MIEIVEIVESQSPHDALDIIYRCNGQFYCVLITAFPGEPVPGKVIGKAFLVKATYSLLAALSKLGSNVAPINTTSRSLRQADDGCPTARKRGEK